MSVPTGSPVEAQAQSSGAAPTPGPCPGGDVPREGSRDIQQKGKIIAVAYDWCYSTDSPIPYRPWAWQSSPSNLANTVRQTDCRSHVLGSIVNRGLSLEKTDAPKHNLSARKMIVARLQRCLPLFQGQTPSKLCNFTHPANPPSTAIRDGLPQQRWLMSDERSADAIAYRLRVELAILGSDQEFPQINTLLGVNAKHSARKGQSVEQRPVAWQNVWAYWGDGPSENADVVEQWAPVGNLILRRQNEIAVLGRRATVRIAMVVHAFSAFPGMHLSPSMIAQIAAVGEPRCRPLRLVDRRDLLARRLTVPNARRH